ncbi:LptE family protein, partial [Flavobacterium sp.]
MKALRWISLLALLVFLNGCGGYSFTGIQTDAKTVQVKYFQNTAPLVEPGIERIFTNKLQEAIQNQTRLSLTSSNGDLVYEGEIVDYRVSPMTSTANFTAAQNRLTITV